MPIKLLTAALLVLIPLSACAPDEDVLVFSSGRTGDGDIYVFRPASGEVRLHLGTDAPEGTVRYDPFRDRLVHHRFTEDGAMLMSGERDLFEDPNGDVAPQWSSRGEIAYVVEDSAGSDLFVADSLNRQARRLTRDGDVERYPAWAPDGRQLAYAKRRQGSWDLYVFDLETSEETRLTELETYVGHPAWSPDGSRIAFDTMVGDQAELAVLDLSSGEVRRLTDRPGNDLIPSWSSDGRRVAFGGDSATGNWDVWILDLESGELTRVTTDPASDGGPVFVPASALDIP